MIHHLKSLPPLQIKIVTSFKNLEMLLNNRRYSYLQIIIRSLDISWKKKDSKEAEEWLAIYSKIREIKLQIKWMTMMSHLKVTRTTKINQWMRKFSIVTDSNKYQMQLYYLMKLILPTIILSKIMKLINKSLWYLNHKWVLLQIVSNLKMSTLNMNLIKTTSLIVSKLTKQIS